MVEIDSKELKGLGPELGSKELLQKENRTLAGAFMKRNMEYQYHLICVAVQAGALVRSAKSFIQGANFNSKLYKAVSTKKLDELRKALRPLENFGHEAGRTKKADKPF